MDTTNDLFFKQNLTRTNIMVFKILLFSGLVPLLFIILTLAHIWVVPHKFSLAIIAVSLFSSIIDYILIKTGKFQKFVMYFGLIATSAFVMLLGSKNVIILSISYGIVPFISCLYYNKKFTSIINLLNYLSVFITYIIKSREIHEIDVYYGYAQSSVEWFISHIIGITIEFFFVLLVSRYISRRMHTTLENLIKIQDEKEKTNRQLYRQNENNIKLNNELKITQFNIIQFVSQVLGSHDLFTGRHVTHTKKYVEIICLKLREMGHYQEILTDENIRLFSSAAFLHDIGKVHIPEAILNKMGRFTEEEFDLMKSHTTEGKKLLEYLPPIENGLFNKIAIEMAYGHHEKWNGKGYPQGLRGTQIPLSARIMAGADVLDALISQRLYKDPVSLEDAMKIFEESKGTHFEPCIADAVIQSRARIEAEDTKFKEQETSSNAAEIEWWQRYYQNKQNA